MEEKPQASPKEEAPPPPPPKPDGIISRARTRQVKNLIKLRAHVAKEIVDLCKTLPAEWRKMNAQQQEQTIERCLTIGGELVDDLAETIAGRGFHAMGMKIDKFIVDSDGALKCPAFTVARTSENIDALDGQLGAEMVLVPVPMSDWKAADPTLAPDKVEGDLGLPKPEAPPATPPAAAPAEGEPTVDPSTGEILDAASIDKLKAAAAADQAGAPQ